MQESPAEPQNLTATLPRKEYTLDLSHYASSPVTSSVATVRPLANSDAKALANLLFEAYVGTIDYQGETREQACDEVNEFLAGKYGAALLAYSWIATDPEGLAVSACLVSLGPSCNSPLVTYLMTHPQWKNRGVGSALLRQTLGSLATAGYQKVTAFITQGNVASEAAFKRHGFVAC